MADIVTLDFADFNPRVVEKVTRLLAILERLAETPFLSRRVALHGGTALNLFTLNAPRLSVDIDLSYIGSTDRRVMLAERPEFEEKILAVSASLGYSVHAGKAEHSGRSVKLGYSSEHGDDHVKIDLNYLNRSPLLPVQISSVRRPNGATTSFPVNAEAELIGGKLKALVSRVAVRDLYDTTRIAAKLPSLFASPDALLVRRVILYNLVKSDPFPRPFEIASRFAGRQADVENDLYPVLAPTDRPSLESMIATATAVITEVSQPHDEHESEFVDRAARADFAPELLFAEHPEVLAAALADPSAVWKIHNLSIALGSPREATTLVGAAETLSSIHSAMAPPSTSPRTPPSSHHTPLPKASDRV